MSTQPATRLTQSFDPALQYSAGVMVTLSRARGVVAALKGDAGSATRYLIESYHAARECGEIKQAISTAANIGDRFAALGDLDTALEWEEIALGLARRSGWPASLRIALMQTGNVLRQLGRHADAKQALLEGLAEMEKEKFKISNAHSIALQYLGELSLAVGEPKEALAYFRQAEESGRALREPLFVVVCWRGQANALSRLGQPDEAIRMVADALAQATEVGSKDEQIKALRVFAELHKQHALPAPEGMSAPSAVLHYLHQALATAGTISGYVLPSELLDEVASAYAAVGDYKEAFANSQAAAVARDHKRLADARDRAIAMQVRQDTERAHTNAEHHRQMAETEARRAAGLQEASATLETLGQIGREITASLNADAVFATLFRHVNELLDTTTFRIYMLDETGETLAGVFGMEAGQLSPLVQIPLAATDSFAARCARERHEVAVDAAPTEKLNLVPGTLRTLSLLFTPLLIGERLLGVMTIQSIQPHAYGERERSIFRTLCAYGAIALDNAAAYRQSETTLKTLRETQAQLEDASITDALTGLRNRRFLLQHIERDVAMILRHHDSRLGDGAAPAASNMDLVFFMVDLDHFKSVNDTYGHSAGDMVLVQMRQRLQEVFRESDYLIRWGGEEFLLIARTTNRDEAAAVAERIRIAVSAGEFDLGSGVKLAKTCSIGFACFPFLLAHPRLLSWSQVVELADQGLYMAKRGGRNGWTGLLGGEQTSTKDLFQRLMSDSLSMAQASEIELATSTQLSVLRAPSSAAA